MEINWKQKLTSRKFWTALTGFVTALMVIFNINEITQEQIIGLISATSILIAYIIGEGIIDKERVKQQNNKE